MVFRFYPYNFFPSKFMLLLLFVCTNRVNKRSGTPLGGGMMAAESEMKPTTTDGVGRRADELVSTGTRAAKAAPAPGQRGPSDQRSSGARVEAADEPDAAVPTQPRTTPAR